MKALNLLQVFQLESLNMLFKRSAFRSASKYNVFEFRPKRPIGESGINNIAFNHKAGDIISVNYFEGIFSCLKYFCPQNIPFGIKFHASDEIDRHGCLQ